MTYFGTTDLSPQGYIRASPQRHKRELLFLSFRQNGSNYSSILFSLRRRFRPSIFRYRLVSSRYRFAWINPLAVFFSVKGVNFMTMVCFDVEGKCFNYRVAGIALRNQQVLLNRFEGQGHWFLPGGRVEMGETSRDGLRREMQEELQEDVHVGRLLWIAESFFDGIEGKNYHE